jgi:hypothetical protein
MVSTGTAAVQINLAPAIASDEFSGIAADSNTFSFAEQFSSQPSFDWCVPTTGSTVVDSAGWHTGAFPSPNPYYTTSSSTDPFVSGSTSRGSALRVGDRAATANGLAMVTDEAFAFSPGVKPIARASEKSIPGQRNHVFKVENLRCEQRATETSADPRAIWQAGVYNLPKTTRTDKTPLAFLNVQMVTHNTLVHGGPSVCKVHPAISEDK